MSNITFNPELDVLTHLTKNSLGTASPTKVCNQSNEYTTHKSFNTATTNTASSLSQPMNTYSNLTIFIDACHEAQNLTEKVNHYLSNTAATLLHPLDTSQSPATTLKILKQNVLACDLIIVPFKDGVPLEWLQERIKYYNRTHIYRDQPLYVSIFSEQQVKQLELKSHSSQLYIRECHEMSQCLKMEENA